MTEIVIAPFCGIVLGVIEMIFFRGKKSQGNYTSDLFGDYCDEFFLRKRPLRTFSGRLLLRLFWARSEPMKILPSEVGVSSVERFPWVADAFSHAHRTCDTRHRFLCMFDGTEGSPDLLWYR